MTQENSKNDESTTNQQLSICATGTSVVAATTTSTTRAGNFTPRGTAKASEKYTGTTVDETEFPSERTFDFIGTGKAVKALFSIPYNNELEDATGLSQQGKPLCLAIHNLDGTLIIDQAEDEENYHNSTSQIVPAERTNDSLPSCESLALAFSPNSSQSNAEALSLLSNIVNTSAIDGSQTGLPGDSGTNKSQTEILPPPVAPREFIEWNFHDMNLLVGSDALIVRPSTNTGRANDSRNTATSAGIAVRVEQINHLQNALRSFQLKQQLLLKESRRSYAQVLSSQSPRKLQTSTHDIQRSITAQQSEDGFDEIPLQTCVIPSSGPLGGRVLLGPSTTSSDTSAFTSTLEDGVSRGIGTVPSSAPAISIVLDAYLDNLMANVPQLALCLQEKGLVQSIKILQTDQIPSMMMHPSTLDTSSPVDLYTQSTPTSPTIKAENMFSPQIMGMNASALLRFLKANCTHNNATYLLRHEPPSMDGKIQLSERRIQLFDISSLSTQGQKKWIWWLATMSNRFALRLRHLELAFSTTAAGASPISESQKRSIRDRQRSLFQQTLDLLQDLMDMDGNAHESLVASVREHLADTYLGSESTATKIENAPGRTLGTNAVTGQFQKTHNEGVVAMSDSHLNARISPHESFVLPAAKSCLIGHENPYNAVSVDALNKAQDHLLHGIMTLSPLFQAFVDQGAVVENEKISSGSCRRRKRPGQTKKEQPDTVQRNRSEDSTISPAIVMQMLGMNHKLVNVSLRLSEHHLSNYFSSSAMQALRTAARRLAEAVGLVNSYKEELFGSNGLSDAPLVDRKAKAQSLFLQYVLLLEHCGHFARSFASDELWRDQGHASGEDVLSVLREVEAAFVVEGDTNEKPKSDFVFGLHCPTKNDELWERSNGLVDLQSLSAIVESREKDIVQTTKAIGLAERFLGNERVLQREKRRVLVASCVCYSRAIVAFRNLMEQVPEDGNLQFHSDVRNLLYQRMGDACNETGKVLLSSLTAVMTQGVGGEKNEESKLVANQLLRSSQFWFSEGLFAFKSCVDVRNLALLRCNVCQSYKLGANALLANGEDISKHEERNLQHAVDELIRAHDDLGQRDTDPQVWDMVSQELATTNLLLGTRRRQSRLGGGTSPVALAVGGLSPGDERAIVDPMKRALEIYEQLGNAYKVAAVHYQLALTFSKMWTCQTNENKTREKLMQTFAHYGEAFGYFSTHVRGNECTFCLLCLDLGGLYAVMEGEAALVRALGICLESRDTFAPEALKSASMIADVVTRNEWFEKMGTIAKSMEERVYKLLRSLVKLNEGRYKNLYKTGLTAKMVGNVYENEEMYDNTQTAPLFSFHGILMAIKAKFDDLTPEKNASSIPS